MTYEDFLRMLKMGSGLGGYQPQEAPLSAVPPSEMSTASAAVPGAVPGIGTPADWRRLAAQEAQRVLSEPPKEKQGVGVPLGMMIMSMGEHIATPSALRRPGAINDMAKNLLIWQMQNQRGGYRDNRLQAANLLNQLTAPERQLAVQEAITKRAEQTQEAIGKRAEAQRQFNEEQAAKKYENQSALADAKFQQQLQLQQGITDRAMKIEELRANRAGKDDIDKETRLLIKDYHSSIARERVAANNALKAAKEFLDPNVVASETERIKRNLDETIGIIKDSYKPIFDRYNIKISDKEPKQTPNTKPNMGWQGPAYYRGLDGQKIAIRTEEEYKKVFGQ